MCQYSYFIPKLGAIGKPCFLVIFRDMIISSTSTGYLTPGNPFLILYWALSEQQLHAGSRSSQKGSPVHRWQAEPGPASLALGFDAAGDRGEAAWHLISGHCEFCRRHWHFAESRPKITVAAEPEWAFMSVSPCCCGRLISGWRNMTFLSSISAICPPFIQPWLHKCVADN